MAVVHAETPTLETGAEQAGLSSPVSFLPENGIDNYRFRVLYAANLVRNRVQPHDQMELLLEATLESLQDAVGHASGQLTLRMVSGAVDLSRAASLIEDYGAGEADDEILMTIPSNRITAAGALALAPTKGSPRPVLDLRVQTSLTDDKLLTPHGEEPDPVKHAHPGMWHRFSLDKIIIASEA